eukprot:1385451-Amphidinium_carterae.1
MLHGSQGHKQAVTCTSTTMFGPLSASCGPLQEKDRFQEIAGHKGAGGKRDCFERLARSIAPS